MKLPLNLARKLQELTEKENLPFSQFTDKNLLEKFIEDGVLEITFSSRTKKNVHIKSLEYLKGYLFNHFSIPDLSAYILVMSDKESGRADLAIASGDSKIKSGNVFSGFLVNAYEDIYGKLNDERVLLKPVPGSFIFINDFKNLVIPEDITVIIIENFENFKFIELQKKLFPSEKKLFAWRYQNNALSEWLSNLPNKYLHFGDFDLAGLHIYLNFKNKRNGFNSSFLIPDNIEELIEKYGSRERYLIQLEYVKNIDFNSNRDISSLAEMINKYQKSLEQEIFIRI